ncbi:26S proteasome regulatory subunit S10B homolog B-like [Hibiscus syriacus]|uniref:26S proteasome regulatory subunit S10B homolog B-like n=1 Tax=Hibiscus syriacus TaxID=106335 RepID=UPI0019250A5A|nr:26S proteasome regulatory subunit S10B homolog B-like [Hibiscus syriacus]
MSNKEDIIFRRRVKAAMSIKKVLDKEDLGTRLRQATEDLHAIKKEFEMTEDNLKYLQSAGQFVGEVLRPLDKERFITLTSGTRRVVVGCGSRVDKETLTSKTRVVLDRATLKITLTLPPEVDPVLYKMVQEDPGNISYSALGGLTDQLQDLKDCVELPLLNPKLFLKLGIKPPKGVLLYGPPGTGKTLLARAIASNVDASFLMVVSTAIVDKYIGEGARLIREMFSYARDHQPCIIFMDEIDAIGGRCSSKGSDSDRETERTMMELLNQLDGFHKLDKVKVIMATNRPDVLDPALLSPGRLDKKIEILLPNKHSRTEILKIHATAMAKHGEINYEAVAKLSEGFNGADLRNVCTEAGLFALRAGRDYAIQDDFMKAVRKLMEAKKLELWEK